MSEPECETEHQRADAEGERDRHLQQQQDDDERNGAEKDEHCYFRVRVRRRAFRSGNWCSPWSTM